MATLRSDGVEFNPFNIVQTQVAGIKSIQNLFVTPATTISGDFGIGSSVDITIAAVDISKSILFHGNVNAVSDGAYSYFKTMTMKFISSTVVQISTNTLLNPIFNVRFQVVEFF